MTDKLQALVFGPLETLAGLLENGEATGEEAAELLRLVVAGCKARLGEE